MKAVIVLLVILAVVVGAVLRRSVRLKCTLLAALLLAGGSGLAQVPFDPVRIGGNIYGTAPSRAELAAREKLAASNVLWKAQQDQAAASRWKKSASTNDVKLLAWQQERAARGEASGQYELGLRYLTGAGVSNSPALARAWFAKAAAQGHAKAKAALAKLTP